MSRLFHQFSIVCFLKVAVPILNSGCSVKRIAKESNLSIGQVRYRLKKGGFIRLEDGRYVLP